MNWLLGDSPLLDLKNILSIFEDVNALNEKFNEVGVGGKITLIVIGLSIAIIAVLFVTKLLYENSSLTSFDIRLLPKKDHARFIFGKSISTFIIVTIILFIVGSFVSFLINQILLFEYVTMAIILLVFISYTLAVLFVILMLVFQGIKFSFLRLLGRNPNFRPFAPNQILGPIRSRFPKLFEAIVLFVLVLFGSFHLSLLSDPDYLADSVTLNIVFTLFIFAIQALYLIYILFPKSGKIFILKKITNEMPRYDLILDYYIDDNTSVLNNQDGSKKVIKKLVGEEYIYEIYNVTND